MNKVWTFKSVHLTVNHSYCAPLDSDSILHVSDHISTSCVLPSHMCSCTMWPQGVALSSVMIQVLSDPGFQSCRSLQLTPTLYQWTLLAAASLARSPAASGSFGSSELCSISCLWVSPLTKTLFGTGKPIWKYRHAPDLCFVVLLSSVSLVCRNYLQRHAPRKKMSRAFRL